MTDQTPASAPVPAQDTPGGPGRQPDAPQPPQTAPGGFPDVQGRCPACGGSSLFVGSGGYITCSRIECPEPDAATTLLERNPRTTPDNSATSRDAADKSLRIALTEVLGYLYSLERVGGSVIGYQTVNVIPPGQLRPVAGRPPGGWRAGGGPGGGVMASVRTWRARLTANAIRLRTRRMACRLDYPLPRHLLPGHPGSGASQLRPQLIERLRP
jgi:hypothetical protein